MATKTPFLPQGYDLESAQVTSDSRFTSFQEGKTQIRILSPAFTGYEYWRDESLIGEDDPKVVRSRDKFSGVPSDARLEKGNFKQKHFWAMVVYNYTTEQIEFCTITQKSLQESLNEIILEIGDPREFDIVIKREGKKMNDTKYTMIYKPTSKVDPSITAQLKKENINIKNFFGGRNPFDEASSDDGEVSEDDIAAAIN